MSNELYYRGSSSYEVAVKNRLSALEAQGAMTTHAIRDMSAEVSGTIRQSTYAILASQEALGRTLVHGFNALNNNIMIGFDVMGAKLDAMSEAICSKLDAIHDILNNPLLTASRELYRRALTNYQKGYFEEALEDCKAAVEKNKTDFISWTLLGQIYLFGAGKFSNVIDLDKAEESFFTAAKYIDADIGHSDEANRLASEIYYYLGYTKLIKSNDLLVANNAEESNTKLIEAENSSKRAYTISKENLIAGYEQAKELHFLGNDGEAMRILEELIRADKNYALKASCDKNFESLWGKIDELIERLKDELEEKIKNYCSELRNVGQERSIQLKNEFDEVSSQIDTELSKLEFTYNKFRQIPKHQNIQNPCSRNFSKIQEMKESAVNSFDNINLELEKVVKDAENLIGKDYFSVREFVETQGKIAVSENIKNITFKTIAEIKEFRQLLPNISSERKKLERRIYDLEANKKAAEQYKLAEKSARKEAKSARIKEVIAGIVGSTIGFLFGNIGFLFGDEEFVLGASIVWALIVGGIATYIAYKILED